MAVIDLIKEKLTLCNPSFFNLPGFLDETFSDVTVTVSFPDLEIKSYKLHRIVLAGCSVILHKSLKRHQTLDITVITPAEFELLIMFLYTGDVFFQSVSELCAGLFAAHFYQLENLRSKCSERLREKLSEDCGNALLILQCDERFQFKADNRDLFELVDEKININFRQILTSGVIEQIEENMMQHILQMEFVSGVPEIEVFRALLRWTKARCCKFGIEPVLEKLQETLIYDIRYNLIPFEILREEVVKSGILPQKLITLVLQRLHDEELEVPFCTRPRERIENHDVAEFCALDLVDWNFESTCTKMQNLLPQVGRWSTAATLVWNGEGETVFTYLPETASTNTRWVVQFARRSNNNFSVCVRCASLDAQFRAACIRLFAVVEGAPRVWTELAGVMECGENIWWSRFSNKISELSKVRPIRVCVRAQWTELVQLPHTLDPWKENATPLRFRWQLRGWKAVSPTAEWWSLCSEPFGRSGVLWTIFVNNMRNDDKRKLDVVVQLDHLPLSFDLSGISWNCSLSLWDRHFDEQKTHMEKDFLCEWTVVDDVELESRDQLDLNVNIYFSRENEHLKAAAESVPLA